MLFIQHKKIQEYNEHDENTNSQCLHLCMQPIKYLLQQSMLSQMKFAANIKVITVDQPAN